MSWSPEQDTALLLIQDWYRNDTSQWFYLAGYAGTGKTTLAHELQNLAPGRVWFASFTGKATMVLQTKGCTPASTLHFLIYYPIIDQITQEIKGWEINDDSKLNDIDLLVVDEASMIDEKLATDLLSFGVRMVVIGDPAQLPPPKDEGGYCLAWPSASAGWRYREETGGRR
jgi:exodeoxyribonuclease-5